MTASEWQLSLINQGAIVTDGAVQHFGNANSALTETATSNIVCDLSHIGLLELNGADAVQFLQGQVTNDVKLLNGNNAHYSAYCNPKGRVLALFLAFTYRDHIHLQMPKVLIESIAKRLKMYVMRSQVEIKDVSESIIKFGINGPNAAALIAPLFTDIPTQDYQLISAENGAILKLPTIANHTRFQIFTNPENAIKCWAALAKNCHLAGKPCWDWLDIQMGIPDVSLNTQEQFVPQMLNLDSLDGINFKKGCYTGQEIVARTHYLGTVKRRTYLTSIASQNTPQEGDVVKDAAGNEVGQIVRVAPNLNAGFDALIEMRVDAQENGTVFWQDTAITMKELPYTFAKA